MSLPLATPHRPLFSLFVSPFKFKVDLDDFIKAFLHCWGFKVIPVRDICQGGQSNPSFLTKVGCVSHGPVSIIVSCQGFRRSEVEQPDRNPELSS